MEATLKADGIKVLVDGASGYLGNHVVAALRQRGVTVHALVRPQVAASDRQFLKSVGAEIFEADLAPFASSIEAGQRAVLEKAFNVSHAVHLIGSVAPARNEKFAQLHQGQSSAFASWCAHAPSGNFQRAAMITSLGADQSSSSEYLRSKREAELALLSGLDNISSTIFRPALIVGRKVGNRDSKIIKRYRVMAASRPFIALINGGKNQVQPVFVGDLAEAIATKLLEDSSQQMEICEIGGSQAVSMKEVVAELLDALAVKKPFLEIPASLASGAASLMERFQEVPTLSRDQVKLAQLDNVCSDNALPRIIGAPKTLKEALLTYRDWNN